MEPPRIPRSLRARRSRGTGDADERFARAVETEEADHSGEFADELAVVAALRTLGEQGTTHHDTAHHDTAPHDTDAFGSEALGSDRDGSLTLAARIRITDRVLAVDTDPVPDRRLAGAPDPRQPEHGSPEQDAPQPALSGHADNRHADSEDAGSNHAGSSHTGSRNSRRRRVPAVTAGAVAAGAAVLLGAAATALTASDDARPGESFYGLKQLREDVSLALTFDDEDRALRQLGYASDRIGELRSLAGDGSLDDKALDRGLADFTDDTRSAVTTLTNLATTSGGNELGRLREWAATQTSRLTLLPGAADGQRLLWRIEQRAGALDERMSCVTITSGGADDLGVLPARGTCTAAGTREPGSAQSAGPRPNRDILADDDTSSAGPDGGGDGTGPTHAGPDGTVRPGGTVTLASDLPASVRTDDDPVQATPRWTPPEPAAAPEVGGAAPEPPTGPRLPDGSGEQDGRLTLTTLIEGLGGVVP
ncbi:hypothetical protein GCM10009676_42840 [Prauserella halophila]|uniref:DUF5667 domain-containing protein n=1 Tax=Prauserella halophila TaxID=185641 RepID=A0ABN1WJA9_9PSEU|nr:DUF5667 domain-containing protein [Prauserella halophila]MCP2237843.1 hypothetical protein [Prauserella halophila]